MPLVLAQQMSKVLPPDGQPTRQALLAHRFYKAGEWLRRNHSLFQRIQWTIISVYIVLVCTRRSNIRPRSGGILRLRGGVKPGHFWGGGTGPDVRT